MKRILSAFFAATILIPTLTFAISYTPGQTLDPSCSPSDPTCLVVNTTITAANINATSTTATSTFAGGFNVANGGLLYDRATGFVGIGTTTPTHTLDVNGVINITSGNSYDYNGLAVITASTTNYNYFFGPAGNLTMTGGVNTGLGAGALLANTTGTWNTGVGGNALYSNTTGIRNTATGVIALYSNTTGQLNTANGAFSMLSNTTGGTNVAMGIASLQSNTTGSNNTAIGGGALINSVSGGDNTAVGAGTAQTSFTTSASSTFIGAFSGSTLDGIVNSTAIGYGAIVTASNQIVIGSTSVSSTLLRGSVGIGTASPTATLHVKRLAGKITGTVTTSGTAVTGVSTLFTTEVAVGDTLQVGSLTGVV
ncbi:MAG: hypothetical protein JWO50_143, partial [Candidatus Kaiserbacteria bacterium]|nr:hypothetical protein [Candidatus Kaiserbacteria bacterium]